MFINWWNKWRHSYIMEYRSPIQRKMHAAPLMSQKHYALWRKPNSKDNILCYSVYSVYDIWNRKTIGTEIQPAVARWPREGRYRGMREYFFVVEILHILIFATVKIFAMTNCKFVKIHRILHFKKMNFTICKL